MVTYVKAQMNPANTQLGRAMELTQQRFYGDPKKKVALGWEIVDRNGEQFFEKSGDSFGNSSLLRFDKKNKIGIVILANHQDAELVEKWRITSTKGCYRRIVSLNKERLFVSYGRYASDAKPLVGGSFDAPEHLRLGVKWDNFSPRRNEKLTGTSIFVRFNSFHSQTN